jgi:hypothetical protein
MTGAMSQPFLRRDYTGFWRLPPPLPRRWPRLDVALLVTVIGEVIISLAAAELGAP